MGVLEQILENFPIKPFLLFVVGGFLLFKLAQEIDERARLRRLGTRGTSVKFSLPFGEP